MTDETEDPETLAIQFALDELRGRTVDIDGRVPADEGMATAARLYVETLGLLPYALAPVAPSAGLRGRLLATLSGDETQPSQKLRTPPPSGAVPVIPVAASGEVRRAPATAAARRPARKWPLALAATVALAALGLAGWFFAQLQEERAASARLQAQLRQAEARASAGAAAASSERSELDQQAATLALVTSPAVEICALKPSGSPPRQPAARGVLYVAADHQHWYLALHGLQPAPPGYRYQLWFVAGSLAYSGGSFEARLGERVVLSSETMPVGTAAVRVTLEPGSGSSQPSGPEVLFGDQMYRT